ncbi:MAG: spondin domain-containing protein [Gemmatimonadota bacterium]|nr:spondin domain-containing protein [Gemmatimonadota bacterium]
MDHSTTVRYSSRHFGGVGRFLSLTGIVLIGALATACDEDPTPPVEGTVSGTVTLEGAALSGVNVVLSGTVGDESATTGGDGSYSFSRVIEGSYTVTISGFPSDTEFNPTASVSITPGSRNPTADFAGTYIRTARIMGMVTVEGMGLGGISVALTGTESQTGTTAEDGSFSFGNIRMGSYAVEMSGWDGDRYVFENTMESFSVSVGEQKTVDFMGTRREYTFQVQIENIAPPFAYFPSGIFHTPDGHDAPGPLTSGNTYSFEFEAGPGARLTFATMMVHSNDLFYAPGPGGIELWDGHEQVTGNITDQIQLWDAGTEMNEEPGEGMNQPLQGGPATGEADPNPMVRLADDEWETLPDVDSVITVMLESTGPTSFRVTIENISKDHTLVTVRGLCLEVPLAPGVFVIHYGDEPLFTPGMPDRGQGLEGLAEDGDIAALAGFVQLATGLVQLEAPGVYASHEAPGLLFMPGTTASPGLEAMAEDGNPAILGAEVLAAGGFRTADAFLVPIGDQAPGPLFPGRSYGFEVTAVHGEYLSFVTMLVQSNDIFFAPPESGIALFPDGQPLTGDVTDMVMLWDAGTEVNEKPGIGIFQAPRQLAPNTGMDEMGMVRLLDDEMFTYPPVNMLIRVTVTRVGN